MRSAANWQDVYLGEMVSAIQYGIQSSGPLSLLTCAIVYILIHTCYMIA